MIPKKKQVQQTFFEDRTRAMLVLLALSIIVRIVVLTEWNASVFNFAVWSDASTYNQWARKIITTGDWIGTQPFLMTPLYPYLLAVLYSMTGESLTAVRLLQHAVGIGTILLIYLSAEKLFNRRTAFFASFIAALYGPLLLFANLLLVETLKVFFLILSFYCVVSAKEKAGMRWWIAAGVSIGAAMLCRPTDMLLLIFVISWIVISPGITPSVKLRSSVMIAASALIIVLPVTIRNYAVSKEFIPVTSNGGLNFYLGNNAKAVGVYYNVDGLDLANDPDGRVFLEMTTGRVYTPGEASSYWMTESKKFISEYPVDFLKLFGKKLLLFFHYKEIGQLGYNYHFVAKNAVPVLGYLLTFIIVFPLSVIGIISLRKNWKKYILLFGFLAAQILSVVLFFVTDRFRLSSIPFFILFAGVGIDWLIAQWKTGLRKELMIAGVVTLLAVSLTSILNLRIDDEFSMEHEYIGLNYFDAKLYEKALFEFRQALHDKETFHVRNNIGNVYAAVGNIPAAMQEYRRGAELNPRQSISAFSMGTAFVRVQQFDTALVYFELAKKLNPKFAPAYLNAGLAYWFKADYSAAEKNLEQYMEMETDREKTVTVRQDLFRLKEIIASEKRK